MAASSTDRSLVRPPNMTADIPDTDAGRVPSAWSAGQQVVWPNGVVGSIAAVDFDDNQLMDDAGGWHDMADVDLLS